VTTILMTTGDDADGRARALQLARGVVGRTSPNPAVGAALVRDGIVVGEGATHPPGGPHAEIVALRAAGDRARGATLYVTLEPCSHHGRTPPCADALIAAGVAIVHYATDDPHPVAGGGARVLRAAGVTVVPGEGAWAEEARRINEAFLHWVIVRRPFVTVKWAMSLDGKIATRAGESRWITGGAARRRVHEVRDTTDAILVGSGTALADDPALTTRLEGRHDPHHPLRVVLDGRGRLPATARLVAGRLPGRTLVATTAASPPAWRAALTTAGVEVAMVPPDAGGGVDLAALLDDLGARDITSLLVEGGGDGCGFFRRGGPGRQVPRLRRAPRHRWRRGAGTGWRNGTGPARQRPPFAPRRRRARRRRCGAHLLSNKSGGTARQSGAWYPGSGAFRAG